MPTAQKLLFGLQIGAVGEVGLPDSVIYRDAVEDAKLGQALGFTTAWMIEHHFTDYYPTPNPLVFLSHVAAACPGLDLGTCVMVLPWYNPVRFAEDLAMLQTLSGANLHIGIGRGVAKLEYDAFGVDMTQARDRFREGYEIIKLALKGEPFAYEGKLLRVKPTINARPRLSSRRPQFYGAIGSASSAGIMAEMGLPPIAIAQFPDRVLSSILENWNKRSVELGNTTEVGIPILVQCYIGDTDEEAKGEARRFLPNYFKTQVEHYQADLTPWEDIAGYEQFGRTFANLKKLSDPANIDGFLAFNMVGTPERVAGRIEELRSIGFNHFIVTNGTPGVPKEVRRRMLKRFAAEVMPRFA